MSKMVRDNLSIHTDDYNFDILLNGPIVGVFGNSGVGKSLYFDLVRSLSDIEVGQIKNVECFNYENSNQNNILDKLREIHDTLVLIDNADILLTQMEAPRFLYESDNQYLIMTRCSSFLGIPITSRAELVNYDGTKFRLEYLRG